MKVLFTALVLTALAPLSVLANKLECLVTGQHYNVFVSSQYNTAVLVRLDKRLKTSQIWQVSINNGQCQGEPSFVELGSTKYQYKDPMISPDGSQLFFASTMPLNDSDNSLDFNLWRADWLAGRWQNIRPLDVPVNSEHHETGPWLHKGSLYFASARNGKNALFVYEPKTGKVKPIFNKGPADKAQQGITLSPDGNLALFWQEELSRKQGNSTPKSQAVGRLYAVQKKSGKWQVPLAIGGNLPPVNQSIYPRFTPDGRSVYLAFEREQIDGDTNSGLTPHVIASETLLPPKLFNQHLANQTIDVLADKQTMDSIKHFSYLFDVERVSGRSLESVSINFEPFELIKQKGELKLWTDGQTGYSQLQGGQQVPLTSEQVNNMLASVRYNFIYLFKQATTRLYLQQAITKEQGRLYRIYGKGITPFSVLLSKDKKQILELRYDNLAKGFESDYELVNDVLWPMTFSYVVDNKTLATGRFSNVNIVK